MARRHNHATFFGKIPATVGRPQSYFEQRNTLLDCRGTLVIGAQAHFGFNVLVLTQSHEYFFHLTEGKLGKAIDRPVIVENNTWIGSGSLLYNCTIRERSILAAGTVARSCEIGPGVIVAGNPVEIVARWENDKWNWMNEKWRVLK